MRGIATDMIVASSAARNSDSMIAPTMSTFCRCGRKRPGGRSGGAPGGGPPAGGPDSSAMVTSPVPMPRLADAQCVTSAGQSPQRGVARDALRAPG